MRNRSLVVIMAAALVVVTGCGSAPPGPEGWLPDVQDVPKDPYGGWIEVKYAAEDSGRYRVEGELLAIDGESLYLDDEGVPRSVPLDSIISARLGSCDPHSGAVGGIAFFGVLSTLSNGGFLILTAPAWIAVGAGGSASLADAAIIKSKSADWDEFRMFARFPQGMPPGMLATADLPARVETRPPGEPEPVRATLQPPRERAFWMNLGMGFGGVEDASSGLSFLGGVNLGYKWFMVGTHITGVKWNVQYIAAGYTLFEEQGHLYDLPLLLGVRGNFSGIHTTLSVGPAAYAKGFGDLFDFDGSIAAQGEFLVFAADNFGFGAIVTYNWNDFADFYVVCLGLAIGDR
jgi:hypothetical protein